MTVRHALTWASIAEREPRLLDIERRIEALKDRNEEGTGTRRLCPNYARDLWYGFRGTKAIRAQLNEFIGSGSNSPHIDLRGSAAHDLCYRYLFELLLSDCTPAGQERGGAV